MSESELPRPSLEAERAFAELLERREAGERLELEEWCARHPAIAGELRHLHAGWQLVSGMFERLGRPVTIGELLPLPPAPEEALLEEVLAAIAPAGGARHEVRGLVGEGGTGRVLEVFDASLGRALAMKVLRDPSMARKGSGDSRRVARFLEEARVTGQLEHPALVPVHQLGLDPEHGPYYTMKLVRGESFAEVIARVHAGDAEWSLERALRALLRVCEAVAYAHSRGVVHRDLKPANVMTGDFGAVYVMDWGLARVLGDERGEVREPLRSTRRALAGETPDSPLVTADGDVVGTPDYMAPEQARGEVDGVGPAADVYSLGALLYHLVAGAPPYSPPGGPSDAEELVRRVKAAAPESLETRAPRAAPELRAIVARAMARRPEERYASADELARDLDAFLERRVVRAYERGAWAELRKWVRRNPWPAAAAALALVALAVGGLAAGLVRANAERTLAAERERELRYAAEIVGAGASLGLGRDAARVAAQLGEMAHERGGWELDYLRRWAAADEELELGLSKDVRDAVSLRGSSRWILAGHDGRLCVVDVTGRVVQEREAGFPVDALALSADEGWLVAGGDDGSLAFAQLSTDGTLGQLVRGEAAAAASVLRAAFVGEEPLVAVVRRDGDAELWWAPDAQRLEAWKAHVAAASALAASADGAVIATGASDGLVKLWDLAGLELIRQISMPPGDLALALATREGGGFVAGTAAGRLVAFDIQGEPRELAELGASVLDLSIVGAEGRGLAGTNDGRLIRFGPAGARPTTALDAGAQVWAVDEGLGGIALAGCAGGRVLLGDPREDGGVLFPGAHAASSLCAAFDPRGERLATGSADRTVRLWDPQRGLPLATFQGHGNQVVALAWSPDGERLVSVGVTGTAIVWDPATGAPLRRVRLGPEEGTSVLVLPDGRALAGSKNGGLRRFALEGDEEPELVHEGESAVLALALAAGGAELLAARADGSVTLHDPGTGAPRRSYALADMATLSLAAHPTRRAAAVAFEDGRVALLELDSGAVSWAHEGHAFTARGLAYDPTGRLLASAGEDTSLRLFETRLELPLLDLRGHGTLLQGVAFSPDGRRIATVGLDRRVALWSADPPLGGVLGLAAERARERAVLPRVDELYRQLRWREEVERALRADASLARPELETALRLAAVHAPDPAWAARDAFDVLNRADLDAQTLTAASALARACMERAPLTPECKLALAAALVREGRPQEALAQLPPLPPPDAPPRVVGHLGSIYVRALAEHALGRLDDARLARARLAHFAARDGQLATPDRESHWLHRATRELDDLLASAPAR